MTDPVTVWFEVMQYCNNKAMKIANLMETTWLIRYSSPVEITYDQGGEFLGHEFKNILIENEYRIKTDPASPRNLQANKNIERIHQVIGDIVRTQNLQETYLYDDDPWMGILAAAYFELKYTYHRKKGKSPGQIVFGQDLILPINHISSQRYKRQREQAQIDKDVIRENTTRIDHNYRVGDKLMILTKSAYKYEALFRGPYEIVPTWTNVTATLQTGAVTTEINIRNIRPYNTLILEVHNPPQEV